ncbi:MAG: UDP-4-amino-4,6-dideoxy-N-acetyl-beta-L-altrosamine transaminase [Syntrophaceae bacterium]|nr:UDP-4-amino-4,6-dideoxy-N-acetyl-beta-L-altrosamine transaminase [Syntrophaceae bacterium]
MAEIIEKCLKRDLAGLYNCACRDSWSKYGFGRNIAKVFGLDQEKVLPTSLAEAGFKARRGKDLRLNVGRLERKLGERLPTMFDSLRRFHQDRQRGLPGKIKKGAGGYLKAFYPERDMLNYGGQAIDQADIEAVVTVMKSPYLTQGAEISRFEEEIASYVGAQFGVAVSSGTAALHLACLACDLGPGDEGVTSPITFLASANAMAYCGATPRFADIDPHTYNMDPSRLEKRITKRTRVVIPVHFAGQSCDMRKIREVVSRKEKLFGHKIFIIEDASHALGSLYRDQRVGCCEYADAAVFSFHPVKHITAGEGGMLVTNSRDLAERIRKLRSHGMTKDPDDFVNTDLAFSTDHSPNPWYYEQVELGFNYRITDIQCSLGRSQLKKLEWFSERRRLIADKYNRAFAQLSPVTIPFEASECRSNFHLYVLQIEFDAMGLTRAAVMERLREENILTQVHYVPVYLQPYYQRRFGEKLEHCPKAEEYYRRCLSLPFYPAMSEHDVGRVIEQICHQFGEKQ